MEATMTTILEGPLKYRQGRKWKPRWCVIKKPSPVADKVFVLLYKHRRDRVKLQNPKYTFSLEGYYGVEAGFLCDKEGHAMAVVCEKSVALFAFQTREDMVQFEIRLRACFGEGTQYPVRLGKAPPNSKLPINEVARLHVQPNRLCVTAYMPPKVLVSWDIKDIAKIGPVEGRFVLEGSASCGRGAGVFVFLTPKAEDIMSSLHKSSPSGAKPTMTRRCSQVYDEKDPLFQRRIDSISNSEGYISNHRYKRHSIDVTEYCHFHKRLTNDRERVHKLSGDPCDRDIHKTSANDRNNALYDIPPSLVRPFVHKHNICNEAKLRNDLCNSIERLDHGSFSSTDLDKCTTHVTKNRQNRNRKLASSMDSLIEDINKICDKSVADEKVCGSGFKSDDGDLDSHTDGKLLDELKAFDDKRQLLTPKMNKTLQNVLHKLETSHSESNISNISRNCDYNNTVENCASSNCSDTGQTRQSFENKNKCDNALKIMDNSKSHHYYSSLNSGVSSGDNTSCEMIELDSICSPHVVTKIAEISDNSKLSKPLPFINFNRFDNGESPYDYVPLPHSSSEQRTYINHCAKKSLFNSHEYCEPNSLSSNEHDYYNFAGYKPPPIPPKPPDDSRPAVPIRSSTKPNLPPKPPPRVPTYTNIVTDQKIHRSNSHTTMHSSKKDSYFLMRSNSSPLYPISPIAEDNSVHYIDMAAQKVRFATRKCDSLKGVSCKDRNRNSDYKFVDIADSTDERSSYIDMAVIQDSIKSDKTDGRYSGNYIDMAVIQDSIKNDKIDEPCSNNYIDMAVIKDSVNDQTDGMHASNYIDMAAVQDDINNDKLAGCVRKVSIDSNVIEYNMSTSKRDITAKEVETSNIKTNYDGSDIPVESVLKKSKSVAPFPDILTFLEFKSSKDKKFQSDNTLNVDRSSNNSNQSIKSSPKAGFLSRFIRWNSRDKKNKSNSEIYIDDTSSSSVDVSLNTTDVLDSTTNLDTTDDICDVSSNTSLLLNVPCDRYKRRSLSFPNESVYKNQQFTLASGSYSIHKSDDANLMNCDDSSTRLIANTSSSNLINASLNSLENTNVSVHSIENFHFSSNFIEKCNISSNSIEKCHDSSNSIEKCHVSSNSIEKCNISSNSIEKSMNDITKLTSQYSKTDDEKWHDLCKLQIETANESLTPDKKQFPGPLSPSQQAIAIAKHVTSLPPFIPPKIKIHLKEISDLSPVLENGQTTIVPEKLPDAKSTKFYLSNAPDNVETVDKSHEGHVRERRKSSPATMKRKARESLRITPAVEDEEGNIWVQRSKATGEYGEMSATSNLTKPEMIADIRERMDSLSVSSHGTGSGSETYSCRSEDLSLRSSPASTVLRPRSGKEYRQIERRLLCDGHSHGSSPVTPQSPASVSSSVFTFDQRSGHSASSSSTKSPTVYRSYTLPHSYVNIGRHPPHRAESLSPYVNVDMTPPNSPRSCVSLEQMEPMLNYVEVDMSRPGDTSRRNSRRSTTPKSASVEYAKIDLVATEAVSRASKQHAQSREDSLRRNSYKFTHKDIKRSSSARDRKTSTTSGDSSET